MRHAIVVGGGIGGLAAGLALRRAGIEATVLERSPVLAEIGAGISLWANALKALDGLGVGHEVRAIGCLAAGALRRDDGRVLSEPAAGLLARQPDFCLVVHRADLQARLAAALGSGALRLGSAVEAVRDDGTGVTVRRGGGARGCRGRRRWLAFRRPRPDARRGRAALCPDPRSRTPSYSEGRCARVL